MCTTVQKIGVFLKKFLWTSFLLNFIWRERIKLIKSDSKDIYNVKNDLSFIKES